MDGSVRRRMVVYVSMLAVLGGCFSAGEVGEALEAADEPADASPADACSVAERGAEICDGLDNDCDGAVDEEFHTGSCSVGTGACRREGTWRCASEVGAECDAEPGEPSEEICGDEVDNDCDGEVDEADATDAETWYADDDGDGYGDPEDSVRACERPDGYVDNDEDCDDDDPEVHPRSFVPDQDGDGYTRGSSESVCSDADPPDGYAAESSSLMDCDDSDDSQFPGAAEVCDGEDTDCDGTVDNIAPDSSEGTVWYVDCDGDGYAPGRTDRRRACEKPASSELDSICDTDAPAWTETEPVDGETDCKDSNPEAHPHQSDWFDSPMNGLNLVEKWDYDCDGDVDRRYTEGTSCDGQSSGQACYEVGPAGVQFEGGWVGGENPDVECGETEPYHDCHAECCIDDSCGFKECSACDDEATTKTQECR